MLAKQQNNQIDFSDNSLVLPEQVDFYIRDKESFQLVPNENEKIVVSRKLRETVEKSNLFREEDKKQFIFE
jgi:hypothetical protein